MAASTRLRFDSNDDMEWPIARQTLVGPANMRGIRSVQLQVGKHADWPSDENYLTEKLGGQDGVCQLEETGDFASLPCFFTAAVRYSPRQTMTLSDLLRHPRAHT